MRFARAVATALLVAALAACASPGPAKASYTKVEPSPGYPLRTCVVTGDSLGEYKTAVSCQGTEVQLCCPGCVAEFAKDPERYVAKVRAATR